MLNDISNGICVILDRYAYSGVAYSSAKGLDLQWCKNSDIGLLKPDIVFFLKMSEKEGTTRKDYGNEIFEKTEFQLKVRKQYDLLREDFWTSINAMDTIERVHKHIVKEFEK